MTTVAAVRKTIDVAVAPERAFAVFCDNMKAWWPMDTHHIGAHDAVDVLLEPRAGGRWFERDAQGAECDWGRVLAYEPPSRLVLDWQIGAAWSFDPGLHTEVEVRFLPVDGGTRVELEHRDLEAFGDAAPEMATTFDSPGGWPGLLEAFARGVGAG